MKRSSLSEELNKPLGQKNANPDKPAKRGLSASLVISLMTFFLVVGIAGWLFFAPKPAPETIVVAANSDNQEVSDGGRGEANGEADDEGLARIPQRNREHDPDAPSMQELEPKGDMREPSVVPESRPVREVRQNANLAHNPDPELIERTSLGVIPKISADGNRPMDVYSAEPLTQGNYGIARVVIVVGGLGISQTATMHAIRDLPSRVTLGFAPYGNSLARWMQQARKSGHELVLQVPMEPYNYPSNNPGAETLRTDVGSEENIANLYWAMSRITNYVGITNYLGGKFMSTPEAMRPVMEEMANRGLLFLDDGSSKNTVSEGIAAQTLLPFAKGTIQLDTVRNRAAILNKLNEMTIQAKRTGLAIGVASAFPESIEMISKFAKQIEKDGKVEITPLSAVAKVPQN